MISNRATWQKTDGLPTLSSDGEYFSPKYEPYPKLDFGVDSEL